MTAFGIPKRSRGGLNTKRFITLQAALFGVLLLAANALVLYYSGVFAIPTREHSSYAEAQMPDLLCFTEQSRFISSDERYSPQLCSVPEKFSADVIWSSSNAAVAIVSAEGEVTPLSAGHTVITAQSGECTASMNIFVVDDLLARSADILRIIADGEADSAILTELFELCSQLGDSGIDGAQNMQGLLREVAAYREGAGNSAALEAAISAVGIDRTVCRTAAAVCCAMYEQSQYDAVISFAGDCTLARYNEQGGSRRFPSVYAASGSFTYPFDRVKGLFACDDATVINFEGTLTDRTAHRNKNFYFRGLPSYARILPESGIEYANLANNHSGDYFDGGFADTAEYLAEAGVGVFYDNHPVYIQTGRAEGVAFISASAVGGYTDDLHAAIVSQIEQCTAQGVAAVVNLHWGTEGAKAPEQWQIDAAHRLIDAGAQIIIGHHPHVLQGIELYNGKYIVYSLGNFAFGGNASTGSPETAVLRVGFSRDADGAMQVCGLTFVPCYTTSSGSSVNNYQPMICFGVQGDSVYDTLIQRSAMILGGIQQLGRWDI